MARKITPTHVLLNQIELSSSASSVTFSNIPQGYGDLIFTISGSLVTDSITDTLLRLNGDSSSNYTRVYAYADGAAEEAGTGTLSGFYPYYLRGNQANAVGHLMDYSATDKHKTLLSRQNGPTGASVGVSMQAQRWANTAAVTKLEFVTSNNYAQGTIFSLYGVYA